MINTAVILAAGMGVRLQAVVKNVPKGFIELDGETLIRRSIRILKNHGITRIIIATGHLKEFYEELAAEDPAITTVHNEVYATSGSMYSLYCAREAIHEDFLILESDLLYEPLAVQTLAEARSDNVLLVSGATDSGDEVYVETAEGRVSALSKKKETLTSITGELVGITRISLAFYQEMIKAAEIRFAETLKVEYEECLVLAGKIIPLEFIKIDNLLWAEIDDPDHLERVTAKILPAIRRKENT